MRKTIKSLATFLAIILAISMLPLSVMATEVTSGDTSAANTDAAAISTPEQFMDMAADGNYYLTKDIDFSNETILDPYLVENFYGTLNGNGYTLSGIKLNYTATEATASAHTYVAIFGTLGNSDYSTSISNVKIDNIEVTVNDSATTDANAKDMYIAFVAAQLIGERKISIDNVCVTNAKIDATLGNRGFNIIGGIVADGGYVGVNISNCSVSGSIVANATGTSRTEQVAGILGYARTNANQKSSISNCQNNADLTLSYAEGKSAAATSAVGGIVGTAYVALTIIDCENNGTLMTTAKVGGILGNMDNTVFLVIADCNTKSGDIYGVAKSGVRLCVAGCTVGDTTRTASPQNTEMTPISQASDFALMDGSDGFFYLENDIDFSGESASTYIINSFSGVLYGNGKTIKNLRLENDPNSNGGNAGFINYSASTADTVILNMTIGTPTEPVSVVGNGKGIYCGVLIQRSGVTATASGLTEYNTTISGVDIYANIQAGGKHIGGFVGNATDLYCYDCNLYGTVTDINNPSTTYVGSFIGYGRNAAGSAVSENSLVSCNNYSEIITTDADKRIGGFIGAATAKNTLIIDCDNYGDILHNSETTGWASAFVATTGNVGSVIINNCANFGDIEGVTCGTAFAQCQSGTSAYTRVNGVRDFGAVRAAAINGDMSERDTVVGCTAEAAIKMQKGAAIRIDPAVTGLRYKADISGDALARLVNTFGEDAVSYGTIIAPEAFVTAAGSDFTVEAMEELENVTRKDLFADKGVDAYVDIPAGEWFADEKGVEKNVIAGSIVNMSGLYKDRFIGRAYVKVTVNANKTIYLYADYYEGNVENNIRTVEGVTDSAVNDLLYKKGDEYFKYENEAYVKVTDAEKIEEYSVNVGTEGDYTKLSCYSSDDYKALTDLLTLINK